MISVFSRLYSRYLCLQLPVCLIIAVPAATQSSAFKLLPGRLPAGTAKSEFQRTGADYSKNPPSEGGEIHLHPSWRKGWSILSQN
jgi:hypothetical protein